MTTAKRADPVVRRRMWFAADDCIGIVSGRAYAAACGCRFCVPARLDQAQKQLRRMQAVLVTQRSRLDESAVEELMMGISVVSSPLERRMAVLHMTREGRSAQYVADRLQVHRDSVYRIQAGLRREGLL